MRFPPLVLLPVIVLAACGADRRLGRGGSFDGHEYRSADGRVTFTLPAGYPAVDLHAEERRIEDGGTAIVVANGIGGVLYVIRTPVVRPVDLADSRDRMRATAGVVSAELERAHGGESLIAVGTQAGRSPLARAGGGEPIHADLAVAQRLFVSGTELIEIEAGLTVFSPGDRDAMQAQARARLDAFERVLRIAGDDAR